MFSGGYITVAACVFQRDTKSIEIFLFSQKSKKMRASVVNRRHESSCFCTPRSKETKSLPQTVKNIVFKKMTMDVSGEGPSEDQAGSRTE